MKDNVTLIRKLIALAVDPGSSEDEARSAALEACRRIVAHNIQLTEAVAAPPTPEKRAARPTPEQATRFVPDVVIPKEKPPIRGTQRVVIPTAPPVVPFTGRVEIPKAPTVRYVTKSHPKK